MNKCDVVIIGDRAILANHVEGAADPTEWHDAQLPEALVDQDATAFTAITPSQRGGERRERRGKLPASADTSRKSSFGRNEPDRDPVESNAIGTMSFLRLDLVGRQGWRLVNSPYCVKKHSYDDDAF
jgi:hypothetical protein